VIPIKGLFEAHIIVRDLQRSVAFYRDVLGLEVGIEQPERPATFLWVGGRGKSMLGIFTLGSWPTQMMQHHLSFQVKLEDLLAAPQRLAIGGHNPEGTSHSQPSERRAHRRADRICLDASGVHIL
jgi:catechol 2,3-dioxygenase-like lactoylglutathione lyase family enzyme